MIKIKQIKRAGVEYPVQDYNLFELEQAINAGKVVAIAEDGSLTAIELKLEKYPIEVDGVGVNTLAAAFDLGEEIKLLEDIILTEQVHCKGVAKLNLNGHNIIGNLSLNSGMINVAHGGDLTIDGIGIIDAGVNCYAAVSMTQKGDTDETNAAKLTVNNGKLIGYYYAVCGNGSKGRGNTEVIINSGELTIHANSGTAIFNPQIGKVIINGGKIIAPTGIEMRSGDLTVNNGEIIGTSIPATSTPTENGTTSNGCGIAIAQHNTNNAINVEINGGAIRGYSALYQSNPQETDYTLVNIIINDGIFNTINNGTASIYSENKTGFIKDGVFSPAADTIYMA